MKTFLVFLFISTVSSATDENFLTANKWFSASIYKKFLKQSPGNFLLSPFSLESILALTQSGCRDQTAEEIRTALNFTRGSTEVEETFRNILPSPSGNATYKIHTANKIYVKKSFPVRDDFKRVASEVFQAESENVDFENKQEAAESINGWVEKKTFNKIKNLIDSSSLNDKTRAVLINALYFKANWTKPFFIAYTKRLDFYLNLNEKVPVDMMLLHDKTYNYFESIALKAKFLEVPFKGDDASMVIVLPNEIDGLSLLESQMRRVLKPQKFSRRSVNLGLPRFKIETSIDFKKILKQMGVSRIFDDQHADLSGIAGEKGDLVVDKISQKTFIDVSEEGVEAAAATYSLIAIPMSAPSELPVNFRVNRPFIFYIKVKGVIIFVGRVLDPRK